LWSSHSSFDGVEEIENRIEPILLLMTTEKKKTKKKRRLCKTNPPRVKKRLSRRRGEKT
jgi:hypothetical protein